MYIWLEVQLQFDHLLTLPNSWESWIVKIQCPDNCEGHMRVTYNLINYKSWIRLESRFTTHIVRWKRIEMKMGLNEQGRQTKKKKKGKILWQEMKSTKCTQVQSHIFSSFQAWKRKPLINISEISLSSEETLISASIPPSQGVGWRERRVIKNHLEGCKTPPPNQKTGYAVTYCMAMRHVSARICSCDRGLGQGRNIQ